MKLLILDASENASETFVTLLNEREISTSTERVTDRNRLLEALGKNDWDILLLNEEVEDFEAAEYVDCIQKMQMSTAVFILVTRKLSITDLSDAWLNGIAGLVSLDYPDYSSSLIAREFKFIQQYKKQIILERDNKELQERCRLLLSSSTEAIAYIHDGMHVYANDSYIKMFDCQNMDDVLCTPFIDMVESAYREEMKKKITGIQNPASAGDQDRGLDIIALSADDRKFSARIILEPTLYDGENCLQVFVSMADQKHEEKATSIIETDEQKSLNVEFYDVEELPEDVIPVLEARIESEWLDATRKEVVVDFSSGRLGKEFIVNTMEKNLIRLVCQPLIATSDLEPELYEIEAMLDDEKQLNSFDPEEFKEAVSNNLLGSALDKWCIEKAVSLAAQLHRQGHVLKLLMPVSSQSCTDSSFPNWLDKQINSQPAGSMTLVINLQLSDVLESTQQIITMIEKLHQIDSKVCISNFLPSQKMSSFLSKVRVDYVRLDKRFTRGAAGDREVLEEVAETVRALHVHKVKVIAMDIDNFDSLGMLWEADADLVQGEYFQKTAQDFQLETFAVPTEALRNTG